jgi:small-conductance mechanosensitive channel
VPNEKFLAVKSDLIEKIKLALDREGIRFANNQVGVYPHRGEKDISPRVFEWEEG